jgi:phosphoribosylformimino-5-aminoimidazole carboxamide ribotide isomerase
MQVIPAIDLRGGACVQLVGGSYDEERVRIADPIAAAKKWETAGFARIHVVDLDAATERGNNRDVVRDIIASTTMTVQAGGGLRDFDAIENVLCHGAAAAVLGTRALENGPWLREAASRFPGELIVAVDVRERKVVTRGWTRELRLDAIEAVKQLNDLPLAGILVTAVHREGQMKGADLELVREIVDATRHPLQGSGGIGSMKDLDELQSAGASSAIVGMALYTDALNPETVSKEYAK